MTIATSHLRRATLCDIAEELRCYILSFLSYSEIIYCALTCQTLYKTVKNSVKLQYIIELGAQRLVLVHPRPPTSSVTECLRILRSKGSIGSSFNRLTVTQRLHFAFTLHQPVVYWHPHTSSSVFRKAITHQQLSITLTTWQGDVISKVIDLRTCTPETASVAPSTWSTDHLIPIPGTFYCMDETQDLMVTGKLLGYADFKFQIHLCTISTGEGHPLAHECCIVTGRSPCEVMSGATFLSKQGKVAAFGDRLALYDMLNDLGGQTHWALYVWNWHQGGPADDVFVFGEGHGVSDIRFLTSEKLLILTADGYIELYNVEDLSAAPQLQASFVLSVIGQTVCFRFPSVFHSDSNCARLAPTEEHWIWTTNPGDRVIVVEGFCRYVIISARIFFMDIPLTWFDATSKSGRVVPWSSWGPQNSRYIPHQHCPFGISGSRVIWPTPVSGPANSRFRFKLCMFDFNPCAVARGVGIVIREPFPNSEGVTTYLPYVQSLSDYIFDGAVDDIILDEEMLLVFTRADETEQTVDGQIVGLNAEIIEL